MRDFIVAIVTGFVIRLVFDQLGYDNWWVELLCIVVVGIIYFSFVKKLLKK